MNLFVRIRGCIIGYLSSNLTNFKVFQMRDLSAVCCVLCGVCVCGSKLGKSLLPFLHGISCNFQHLGKILHLVATTGGSGGQEIVYSCLRLGFIIAVPGGDTSKFARRIRRSEFPTCRHTLCETFASRFQAIVCEAIEVSYSIGALFHFLRFIFPEKCAWRL